MKEHFERIEKLKKEMINAGVDLYIVPTSDYNMSEYIPDYFKEREYLSGFTGSAGTLIVTQYEARLFTDGRYFIQAEEELKDSGIILMKIGEKYVPRMEDYIYRQLEKGFTIGYDGRTMEYRLGKSLRETVRDKDIIFKTDIDLVDNIWEDRPKFPNGNTWVLPYKYSGEDTEFKLKRLREEMKETGVDGILVSSLDDVCWLYNVRGEDIEYTPVTLAFSIVTDTKATFYIDENKVSKDVKNYLELNNVIIRPYENVYNDAMTFPGTLLVDPDKTNETLAISVKDKKFLMSLVAMLKCIKNDTEIENIKNAHLKDGVALTKTIFWIKKLQESSEIFRETELSVSKHLLAEREKQKNFVMPSFESIVASGNHSAIVHYEPNEKTNQVIDTGMLLIDSGGHYLEGTTDVTRTISIKEPDAEMKRYYTAVLKGHLDLGMTTFEKNSSTFDLDRIARKPLADKKQGYNHGTGHGVGYLLSVHEDPVGFRKSGLETKDYPFERHMVVSNEPGIYLEGKFGIRIENLMYVRGLADRLRFDTLTLAPYDKASINIKELTFEELEELRWYSEKVYTRISPYLTDEEKMWLREETVF